MEKCKSEINYANVKWISKGEINLWNLFKECLIIIYVLALKWVICLSILFELTCYLRERNVLWLWRSSFDPGKWTNPRLLSDPTGEEGIFTLYSDLLETFLLVCLLSNFDLSPNSFGSSISKLFDGSESRGLWELGEDIGLIWGSTKSGLCGGVLGLNKMWLFNSGSFEVSFVCTASGEACICTLYWRTLFSGMPTTVTLFIGGATCRNLSSDNEEFRWPGY